jgi:hypothetical protein
MRIINSCFVVFGGVGSAMAEIRDTLATQIKERRALLDRLEAEISFLEKQRNDRTDMVALAGKALGASAWGDFPPESDLVRFLNLFEGPLDFLKPIQKKYAKLVPENKCPQTEQLKAWVPDCGKTELERQVRAVRSEVQRLRSEQLSRWRDSDDDDESTVFAQLDSEEGRSKPPMNPPSQASSGRAQHLALVRQQLAQVEQVVASLPEIPPKYIRSQELAAAESTLAILEEKLSTMNRKTILRLSEQLFAERSADREMEAIADTILRVVQRLGQEDVRGVRFEEVETAGRALAALPQNTRQTPHQAELKKVFSAAVDRMVDRDSQLWNTIDSTDPIVIENTEQVAKLAQVVLGKSELSEKLDVLARIFQERDAEFKALETGIERVENSISRFVGEQFVGVAVNNYLGIQRTHRLTDSQAHTISDRLLAVEEEVMKAVRAHFKSLLDSDLSDAAMARAVGKSVSVFDGLSPILTPQKKEELESFKTRVEVTRFIHSHSRIQNIVDLKSALENLGLVQLVARVLQSNRELMQGFTAKVIELLDQVDRQLEGFRQRLEKDELVSEPEKLIEESTRFSDILQQVVRWLDQAVAPGEDIRIQDNVSRMRQGLALIAEMIPVAEAKLGIAQLLEKATTDLDGLIGLVGAAAGPLQLISDGALRNLQSELIVNKMEPGLIDVEALIQTVKEREIRKLSQQPLKS